MNIPRDEFIKMLLGDERSRRFTQDSPILPEVWLKYSEVDENTSVDLLLNPHRLATPGKLRLRLSECLREENVRAKHQSESPGTASDGKGQIRHPLVYNESHVVAQLTFRELIRCALPLTKWWNKYCWRGIDWTNIGPDLWDILGNDLKERDTRKRKYSDDLFWFLRLVGKLSSESEDPPTSVGSNDERLFKIGLEFLEGVRIGRKEDEFLLWSVSLNRAARPTVFKSTATVKADAARQLFNLNASGIRWAIIDGGIDAGHPAFADAKCTASDLPPAARSRIRETYDFTKFRTLLDPDDESDEADTVVLDADARRRRKDLKSALRSGRTIDWDALIPLLRVSHENGYIAPRTEHGTHVAGILGAHWHDEDKIPSTDKTELVGMCPDIELYDLRVLDDNEEGSEFNVLAALQFIRHLNAHKDVPIIHGANLSLSLDHEVTSSACGQSPVCEECERLVGNGVVVVVAAGNRGYGGKLAASMGVAEYQDISITDPGNAEGVITVGSTHRELPHTYGVSYFSSRGPTGDGRMKPDIVAPGEKIFSTVPIALGSAKSKDGTSMAAPHVSGAAALLMARHTELIGQPARVKQILCKTATDLGRERHFQGAGLVDILRAIQSI